ncbi:MaoC family dehydratase N-terminal domain-containing protein [Sphingomonas sp. OK281]|uniref:FAS1-like dehydratase domain-containing protein n=1 Tax=Sphingomonas sp. OK281 TaxID=1881067 RepID=UPI0008DF7CB4|nr:MaoC family dehydratase N-terminal domain-containing protein [Sphingomonas sp. OK281]SFO35247.1 N-terminal half of MaoC dehydratase [Sphingomonas sp. OK281]
MSIILDTSDIDTYLGKPMQPARMVDPFANNDIRRWVQAMHYPNRLHYDAMYGMQSRFGQLIAPQSFPVTMDDGHGSAPSCIGLIPNSHMLFGGDEWWFYGPRIVAGDRVWNERIPFDYTVKETKFGGPTCFQRGDNFYYNQHGDLIAKQRSTSIRYSQAAGQANTPTDNQDDPIWGDEELEALETRKFAWIQMLHELGHSARYWDTVKVGDVLPERVFGPHSIVSFTTEWRSYTFTQWGSMHRRTDLNMAELGFTGPMAGPEQDPTEEAINPENTDGAYIGPSRGHLFPRWARFIGMPRGYGYGASMGAWITDYLAGWAGEWGMVRHSACNYRSPALTGDITIQTATVTDVFIDADGRHMVQIEVKMQNQTGAILATAKAEVELPRRPA